jgi:hypothetical protein
MNLLSKNSERPCVPLDELRATYRSLLTDLLDRAPRDVPMGRNTTVQFIS